MKNINHIIRKEFMELNADDISEINEALLARMLIEFRKNDRSGIYGYTQRAFAYNSNRIEGSTLTERQTASLFETGSFSSESGEIFKSKDVEEMNGHFSMFNHMLKTISEPLSEEMIKQFHFCLKNGVFEDRANGYPIGQYKNRRNIISNIETAKPDEVQQRMKELLEAYHAVPEPDIKILAKLHADYETIHPFQDGNGRTGRIILLRECLIKGILPFIIKDNEKMHYYEALNYYQIKGDVTKLKEYFVNEQKEYYQVIQDFLKIYE